MAKPNNLKAPLEVLPSLLLWAPELNPIGKAGKVTYVDAFELCDCAGESSRYYVEHYQEIPDAYGQAFGPLALDQILRFCRRLKGRLASHTCGDQGPLCLTTASDLQDDHTNASVLLGAYLILVQDWTAKRVTEALGSTEANRKFPCAWAKAHLNDSTTWLMTVSFCWEGLELAMNEGWIDTTCLSDDELTECLCVKYRGMIRTYDASWIVPGKILVSADPVTTMCDPNPNTFTELWASEEPTMCDIDGKQDNSDDMDKESTKTISTNDKTVDMLLTPPSTTSSKQESVATICKHYMGGGWTSEKSLHTIHSQGTIQSQGSNQSMDYSSFLQECGVSYVIRANFSDEHGMPRPSYDAQMWKECRIGHRDIQIVDKGGGLPQKSSMVSLLDASAEMSTEFPGGAVNVHCKGGFGRSVVLACCLAINEYDVSGRALLGWSRIVRPGAITTTQQEKFLISLKGRADILKFAGMPQVSATIDGATVRCGCTLQ